MSKNVLKARTRAVCLGLVMLAALGSSCTREDAAYTDSGQTAGAVAQARSYFESHTAAPTKSAAGSAVQVMPLPGDMTPQWEKAAAATSEGTTWVDVPITAGTTYTAIRPHEHHHQQGETCDHDHQAVAALQKLAVRTSPAGTGQCLIATIVPEADCTVDPAGFSTGSGLPGFSGFVSWHDLDGKLVRVARYENGTKTRSVEATAANETAVLEAVDHAVLYPVGTDIAPVAAYAAPADGPFPVTRTIVPDGACRFCRKVDCPAKGDLSKHCNMCGKYDPPKTPYLSECICPRCTICGKKGGCSCDFSPKPQTACEICGRLFCAHWTAWDGSDMGTPNKPFVSMHEGILEHVLGYLFDYNEFQTLKKGCHSVDQNEQSENYEYLHGIYSYVDNGSQGAAKALMRSYFIRKMKGYIQTGDLALFGEAMHPVLDTYTPLQTRIDMLPYYSYAFKHNVIEGQYVAPYTANATPCIEAVKLVWSQVLAMEPTASDAEVGLVFDNWVATTGRDLPLL